MSAPEWVSGPRFPLGRVLATPKALAVLEDHGITPASLLGRHVRGDSGELCEEDVEANWAALRAGLRLLSSYRLGDGETVWIITEADRSATTLLLPDDY